MRDALYSLPPANLPDTPETRRDMAAYKASARSLDQGVGARARRARAGEHARDLHHRPRARVPRREGDADRPRHRRAADHARARAASPAARSPTRSSPRSTSSRRSASWPAIERPGVAARRARCCRSSAARRRGQRRGVCGDHVPRRLRAAARGAHEALQVHPPLRQRPRGTGAPEHRRQPQQGPAARATGSRSATLPEEELYDLVFDPNEAANIVADASRRSPPSCARA